MEKEKKFKKGEELEMAVTSGRMLILREVGF